VSSHRPGRILFDGGILTLVELAAPGFRRVRWQLRGGGGGNLTVYVRTGATYTATGNSLVFYEPGATISTLGVGETFSQIPELQPSFPFRAVDRRPFSFWASHS
jgi:hypothetical protein